MKLTRGCGLGMLALGMLTLSLQAQVPSAPSVPSAPGGVPGGVPGVPQAPQNIWSKLLPTKDWCNNLKTAFCNHPMGKMISSMSMPFSLYSGGLMNQCCPDQPNAKDLAAGADSPEGAVAAIKADEAGAKARRANMRFLGTVDCHYWPEAESALIKGLRTDKNECVRWEAALSLGRGCCCTKKTMEALRITASASEIDGNPAELSQRVKLAAIKSLNHCTQCFVEIQKPAGGPKEKPVAAAPRRADLLLPRYYAELEALPRSEIVKRARQTLAELGAPPATAPIPPGRQSVSEIIARAGGEPPRPAGPTADGGPIRPVAANGPPTAAPPVAAAPAAPRSDLIHWFKDTYGAPGPTQEPPRAAGATPRGAVPAGATTDASPLPPTGSRDLLSVIHNSIGGN